MKGIRVKRCHCSVEFTCSSCYAKREKARRAANDFGVFKWDAGNRYPRAAALRVFKTERGADAYIEKWPGNNYVTRAVPKID